ncbi:hypothetical protein BGZ94_005649, partial [Podila epigama]
PGEFASAPSLRHHRRSVDRIWPPALEVRLARLSIDGPQSQDTPGETSSSIGSGGRTNNSARRHSIGRHIFPLPPPLVRGNEDQFHSSSIMSSDPENDSSMDDENDDSLRVRRISIWTKHQHERMRRHRHSFGCVHPSNITSSGISSPACSLLLLEEQSPSPAFSGNAPGRFNLDSSKQHQLHPLDQAPPSSDLTVTNQPRPPPSHHSQSANVHIKYMAPCKSGHQSTLIHPHDDSVKPDAKPTCHPTAMIGCGASGPRSVDKLALSYSSSSSPTSVTSSTSHSSAPVVIPLSMFPHHFQSMDNTSSPLSSASSTCEAPLSPTNKAAISITAAAARTVLPPSIILHGFFSELSNGHQLYADPYDSEDEGCMLGQSPSSDYTSTMDFMITTISDNNFHQADSPVYFNGFPLMNRANVD